GADLDAKFDLFIPGMSAEQQARLARGNAAAFTALSKMFDEGDKDDDEKLPPLDTSEPTGEMLAKAMEGLAKMQENLLAQHGDRLAAMQSAFAQGSLGKGPSAREWARDCDRRRKQMGQPGEDLLPALEAYVAARRG